MLFNSIQYLFFLPLVICLYFLWPYKMRWALLLVASCVFYMAFIPKYILVLFLLILIDYFAAIFIERAEGRRRKVILMVSIAANLGLLCIFKYYNFFNQNVSDLLSWLFGRPIGFPRSDLILPIGLSFHTFQSLSYTIEVYFKRFKAERHLGIYAVYVLYFPQMVAGPIERPQNVIPQLRARHQFSYENAISGMRLILLGLAKKVLIGDNLARVVDAVYVQPVGQAGPALLIATYFFALQIYCDFSGYSDIARGSSRFFGIELMQNFNNPYAARSIQDFWSRWHISLSTWFRDYLYIPLGGNRVSALRRSGNLMLVFLVSGFWHGASWTFIIWGALHGLYLVTSIGFQRVFRGFNFGQSTVGKILLWLLTFNLVCFTWIFFRANSLSDAIYIISRMFSYGWQLDMHDLLAGHLQVTAEQLAYYFILAISLLILEIASRSGKLMPLLDRQPLFLRWACYLGAVILIVIGGRFASTQFIYFQF